MKQELLYCYKVFINEYDKIYEELMFGFPDHIKMKVIKNIRVKPNSLNFLASTVATADIVEIV